MTKENKTGSFGYHGAPSTGDNHILEGPMYFEKSTWGVLFDDVMWTFVSKDRASCGWVDLTFFPEFRRCGSSGRGSGHYQKRSRWVLSDSRNCSRSFQR